jgi:urease accessory protein
VNDTAIAPAANRARGGARIVFACRHGRTALAGLAQHDPMRVLLPRPIDDDIPHAVLINTSGGLVGGDEVTAEVTLAAEARAVVTTQAAEKVYRSDGATTLLDNRLMVGAGAWLEWLPNETILFDGARLDRLIRIELTRDAALLAGEILVFGRLARGEKFRCGWLRDVWELRRDDKLIWTDRFVLDEDMGEVFDDPHALAGAAALGVIVYAGPSVQDALPALREALGELRNAAATCLGDVLLLRFLDRDPIVLRARFAAAWRALRRHAGRPDALPGLWHG